MKKFIFFLGLALSLVACSKSQPISSGPYHALKCGLSHQTNLPSKFIFNKYNGNLYYFDLTMNTFKPLTRKLEKGIYFNSMPEFFSRLEKSKWFSGNKLVITQINYLENGRFQKSILKKTIHLRSLVMYTIDQNSKSPEVVIKENCIWIDPKIN
tara:strand:+ start:6231 stop:6692 length:462 start_codon:yes stop_codon:yes gene_type:complete